MARLSEYLDLRWLSPSFRRRRVRRAVEGAALARQRYDLHFVHAVRMEFARHDDPTMALVGEVLEDVADRIAGTALDMTGYDGRIITLERSEA